MNAERSIDRGGGPDRVGEAFSHPLLLADVIGCNSCWVLYSL